jgi:hypothetical protein
VGPTARQVRVQQRDHTAGAGQGNCHEVTRDCARYMNSNLGYLMVFWWIFPFSSFKVQSNMSSVAFDSHDIWMWWCSASEGSAALDFCWGRLSRILLSPFKAGRGDPCFPVPPTTPYPTSGVWKTREWCHPTSMRPPRTIAV